MFAAKHKAVIKKYAWRGEHALLLKREWMTAFTWSVFFLPSSPERGHHPGRPAASWLSSTRATVATGPLAGWLSVGGICSSASWHQHPRMRWVDLSWTCWRGTSGWSSWSAHQLEVSPSWCQESHILPRGEFPRVTDAATLAFQNTPAPSSGHKQYRRSLFLPHKWKGTNS